MRKKDLTIVVLLFTCISAAFKGYAQNAIVQEGEVGIGLGAGHYFGDLNTRSI